MVYNAKINVAKIKAAEKCLIDNGIDKEEAANVLQAIGYVLLDDELYYDEAEKAMVEELVKFKVFPCVGDSYCIETWVEYDQYHEIVEDGINSWIESNLNNVDHWELESV